jgi:hypothetical protein
MAGISEEEYLETAGRLAQQAAFADAYLFTAFLHLSGIERATARCIYFGFDSLAQRKNMTRRVAALKGGEFAKLVDAIAAGVQDAQDARNEMVHALMGIEETVDGSPGGRVVMLNLRKDTKTDVDSAFLGQRLKASMGGVVKATEAFSKLADVLGVSKDFVL